MHFAIVDIETTGGHASSHAMTEIAIIIHDGNQICKQFQSLINPHQRIPHYISSLTGITDEMVSTAPDFEQIAGTVYDLLKDCIFVAHNVNFDYSFVRHQLNACGYQLLSRKLCTVRLSRKVFPGLTSYSLGNLCRSLEISIKNRHRANGDAQATVILLEKIFAQGGMQHIQMMLKKNSGDQWLPQFLEKDTIEKLPTGPGVYYFHNAKGKVIYVGKAINLRKRVSSHFTHNDVAKNRQEFIRLVHRIKYTACANELQALVLESTEIKRLWPQYNKSQKQPASQYGLYQYEDGRGYLRLAIDKKKKHFPAVYHFNLLHEGIVLLKNIIEVFGLHDKLCNINKQGITSEDWLKIGSVTDYNEKVNLALLHLENQLPTFAVIDDGINEMDKLILLIEKGCFKGMGYLPESELTDNLQQLKDRIQPFADNDYIRNSIYAFVEENPEKKWVLQSVPKNSIQL